MAELLVELFSEEIPSRMQAGAAHDLARLLTERLEAGGLDFDRVAHYAGPRRLSLVVDGLPLKSSDVRTERKGPRVDAPEKALEGFLRATGLTLDECEIHDDKKGQFYVAVIDKEGRPATEIIAEALCEVVRGFPWPKAMRWGSGRLRWVRPLHSILCLFDGKPVKFIVDGVGSGNQTEGHRFLSPKRFKVNSFKDYQAQLETHFVVLDAESREDMILKEAKGLAKSKQLGLVEDKALLKEAAGLVEWPVVLMGSFDQDFLDVPPEVLIAAMKKHQKCFSLKKRGKLANRFIMVSNLETEDGGAAIIAGNERVIRARLSDAKFFWDNDLERPLESLLPKLEEIVFHAQLGTVAERAERMVALSRFVAPLVGADEEEAALAARLAKADLVTETVYEEPEMQGIAGRYLALAEGKPETVADAIEGHYKPQGPTDDVPRAPVSIAVALAEKIDLLTGFWAIDEKPTGSKDPFALRRAALGVIRIVLENELRLSLKDVFNASRPGLAGGEDLLSFFADRLKVHLRDQGVRHDLIDAVFSLGGQDDLLMVVKRVEALGDFLCSEDGASLLAGLKRAQNILKIEEGKDKRAYDGEVDEARLSEAAEKKLHKAVKTCRSGLVRHLEGEDFTSAMAELSKLRGPVDTFFDQVIVNDEDQAVRANRLELLGTMRAMGLEVADFSRIEG